jgi:DNA-binding NarL/FixJ family response regulator
MIRLLIADDHTIVREGIKQLMALTSDVQVVEEAINGAQVLECLRKDSFDMLLLDLNMAGISGVELIGRIRAHRPELPILVLSMHNEVQVVTRALKAGANGYISKDCEPEVLLTAIRRVAVNGKFIAPEIAERMVFASAAGPSSRPPHHALSDRELEVFRLLVAGKSVNEIAQLLSISNKTVSTHKTRLLEKLQLTNMADLMRYAMEHNALL